MKIKKKIILYHQLDVLITIITLLCRSVLSHVVFKIVHTWKLQNARWDFHIDCCLWLADTPKIDSLIIDVNISYSMTTANLSLSLCLSCFLFFSKSFWVRFVVCARPPYLVRGMKLPLLVVNICMAVRDSCTARYRGIGLFLKKGGSKED